MRENHLAILIPLLSIAATGCREPCSDDEVRYGDRCVLRPDGGTLHDEDASAADEDGGEWEDEMDAWTATPEEDGSVPSPDNPDDDDDPHDADAGVEDSGTEPPICPDAPGCHRKVVHFTYGAPGCAILDDGTLWCWGGVDGPRLPRQVGQDAEWQAVSSSDNSNDEFGSDRPGNHTCGINGGAMYCWGDNYAGQLGLGSSEDHAVPAPRLVGEAKDWTAVSAAAMPIIGGISCGIRAGALYCWGGTPTRIGSRDDWTSVSAGPVMTCGIAGGTARCWNPNQQITETSILPWTDWQMISSGDTHACGIRGGKAYCWGQNGYGQLGLGTTGTVTSPAQVGSEEDWTFIDTSFSQTCAIRAGALYCWGALSLRTITDEPSMASLTLSPRRIGADSDWATVNVGTQGGCARRTNGQLLCWGSNDYGELGTKRVPTRWIEEPTRVGEADNWLKVATGSTSTCGLRGGELYCWGTLYERRERSTAILASSKPMRVGSASDWTTVAMHFDADHVCGVRNDGLSPSRVWCWGDASVGQLGPEATTSSSSEPVLAGHTGPWLEVAVGAGTSCGQTVSEIVCWGDSWAGPTSVEPNRTLQGTKWGDFGTTMGIHDGRLLEWTSTTTATYSTASKDGGWTAIARGVNHFCGIRDAQLYCWGDNSRGQLGIGARALNLAASRPTQVSSPSSWMAIAARDGSSCGIQSDKTLWCWGGGRTNRISDNDLPVVPEPRAILGEWASIALGGQHVCAISSKGTLWCWGQNLDGQLGLGEAWSDAMQAVNLSVEEE